MTILICIVTYLVVMYLILGFLGMNDRAENRDGR